MPTLDLSKSGATWANDLIVEQRLIDQRISKLERRISKLEKCLAAYLEGSGGEEIHHLEGEDPDA